ncbi:diacylglycerol/lipid kinase family protein [Cytobacillus eiseniae]|nr:diacylglycerol kinase family protein [Cytobacillus eiseniae]
MRIKNGTKIYFIINPQAKNGYCQKVWSKIEQLLLEKGISYEAFFTNYRGHAKEIARKLAEKEEGRKTLIIAVGGDGTMHEVVNGAASFQHVNLSYIPGGSGNDFSRGFGIPKDPVAALNQLLNKEDLEATLTDLGKVSKKDGEAIYFINNMGVGLDASIAREVNESKIKGYLNRLSLGKLAYVYFLLKNLVTFKKSAMEIVIDGKLSTYENAWFVSVSNQPFYGGGMKISPNASPFDDQLNITVVHKISRLKILFVFITVFWGGHVAFKGVEAFTGKEIRISSLHPLPVHADGEDIGTTPLKVITCHRLLPISSNASGQ